MFRRLITIVCYFFLESVPSIQIGVVMYMSIFFAGNNIATKPYKDPSLNNLDNFNEIVYYCTLVFSFSFTDYNGDNDSKS